MSSNFQNGTFEIITITVTEIVLVQVFVFTVASKQKNKNENKEHHGTFYQSRVSSTQNQGETIFPLFGSWSLALYLYFWVKLRFF